MAAFIPRYAPFETRFEGGERGGKNQMVSSNVRLVACDPSFQKTGFGGRRGFFFFFFYVGNGTRAAALTRIVTRAHLRSMRTYERAANALSRWWTTVIRVGRTSGRTVIRLRRRAPLCVEEYKRRGEKDKNKNNKQNRIWSLIQIIIDRWRMKMSWRKLLACYSGIWDEKGR